MVSQHQNSASFTQGKINFIKRRHLHQRQGSEKPADRNRRSAKNKFRRQYVGRLLFGHKLNYGKNLKGALRRRREGKNIINHRHGGQKHHRFPVLSDGQWHKDPEDHLRHANRQHFLNSQQLLPHPHLLSP